MRAHKPDIAILFTVWAVFVITAAVATCSYGLVGGLIITGIAFLLRLKPKVVRVPSPDNEYMLVSYDWFFFEIIFLSSLAVSFWVLRSGWIVYHSLILIIFGCISGLLLILALFYVLFPFWGFHLVLIKQGQRTRTWFFMVDHCDTFQKEYLWMPDSNSIFMAQSGDLSWTLRLMDLDTNRIRNLTFKDDWRLLETFWEGQHLSDEYFLSKNPHAPVIEVDSTTQGYSGQVRIFFQRLMPHCACFPCYTYNMGLVYEKKHPTMAQECFKQVLEMIPPESHFFDTTRELARQRIESVAPNKEHT